MLKEQGKFWTVSCGGFSRPPLDNCLLNTEQVQMQLSHLDPSSPLLLSKDHRDLGRDIVVPLYPAMAGETECLVTLE